MTSTKSSSSLRLFRVWTCGTRGMSRKRQWSARCSAQASTTSRSMMWAMSTATSLTTWLREMTL